MNKIPASKFHVIAAGVLRSEVTDNQLSARPHALGKTPQHQNNDAVGEIVEEPCRPDEIEGLRGQTANDIRLDKRHMVCPWFAERLCMRDRARVLIQAGKIETSRLVRREVLGDIAAGAMIDPGPGSTAAGGTAAGGPATASAAG